MVMRRTLLRVLPVLIAGIIAYFLLEELAFQHQESAYQEIRQKGWKVYLGLKKGDGYGTCRGEIIIDNEQRVWTASDCNTDGIHVLDGTQWTTYTPENSTLQSRGFTDLALDGRGQIWTVDDAAQAVVYFDGEKWVTSLHVDGCAAGSIDSLVADHRGAIWVFLYNRCARGKPERSQVREYQDGNWTTYIPGDGGLPTESVDAEGNYHGWKGVVLDTHGTAQIITENGAFILVGSSWQPLTEELNKPAAFAPALDAQGRMWIWHDSDVEVLEKTGWITLTPENSGLAGEGIYALEADASGRIWIANDEGVSMFAGGEIQPVPPEVIDQRRKILEWRETTRGYSWFLPSALGLLWVVAYLNILSPAVAIFVVGLLTTLLLRPAIGETWCGTQYINPGVVLTYGALLGGIMGRMIDNARNTPTRFRWAKSLPVLAAILGFGIAGFWFYIGSMC